jgi:RHS repeat-associated protein
VQDSFGGTQTSVYDAAERLTSQQLAGIGTPELRADLGYDSANNLTGITRYSDLAGTTQIGATTTTYDTANRVTEIDHADGSGTPLATYTYAYDNGSNLQTQTIDGTTTLTYDATGNRTNTGYSTTANELTTDGIWNYTYDNAGNQIEKVNIAGGYAWTYGYDNANHMVEAEVWTAAPSAGGLVEETINYKYDAFGNRLEQNWFHAPMATTLVQRYAYDGWDPGTPAGPGTINFAVWADLDGNNGNALQTRYLRGDVVDQLFAREDMSGGTAMPYWSLTDRLGSVRGVVDGSGAVKDTLTYDVFGAITSESDSSYRGRYAWTGRELDVETGLQYNRARYYDGAIGRWTSQDPLGLDAGDSNLYRYVDNKLTQAEDPSGLRWVQTDGHTNAIKTLQYRYSLYNQTYPTLGGNVTHSIQRKGANGKYAAYEYTAPLHPKSPNYMYQILGSSFWNGYYGSAPNIQATEFKWCDEGDGAAPVGVPIPVPVPLPRPLRSPSTGPIRGPILGFPVLPIFFWGPWLEPGGGPGPGPQT